MTQHFKYEISIPTRQFPYQVDFWLRDAQEWRRSSESNQGLRVQPRPHVRWSHDGSMSFAGCSPKTNTGTGKYRYYKYNPVAARGANSAQVMMQAGTILTIAALAQPHARSHQHCSYDSHTAPQLLKISQIQNDIETGLSMFISISMSGTVLTPSVQ